MNKVTVYIKDIDQVDPAIMSQLKRLNLNDRGRMKGNLDSKSQLVNKKIFYILDSQGEKVLSWGMTYNYFWYNHVSRNKDGDMTFRRKYTSKQITADIYTHPNHRDKGYGSAIAKCIKLKHSGKKIHACTDYTSIYWRMGFID